MAFQEPVGLIGQQAIVEWIAQAPRWEAVELKGARFLRPGSEVAILVYKAKDRRRGEESSYSAIVSTVYARNVGAGRLAFHQHTPSQPSD